MGISGETVLWVSWGSVYRSEVRLRNWLSKSVTCRKMELGKSSLFQEEKVSNFEIQCNVWSILLSD